MSEAASLVFQWIFVLNSVKLSTSSPMRVSLNVWPDILVMQEEKVYFKIYYVTNWKANNYSQEIEFGQLIEYNAINIFLQKSCRKCGR